MCCRETFIKAEAGESPNDRNDRAIRVATAWYKQRLPQMQILLLTNDVANRQKAQQQGLTAMSVQVSFTLCKAPCRAAGHCRQPCLRPYQRSVDANSAARSPILLQRMHDPWQCIAPRGTKSRLHLRQEAA